MIFRRPSTSYKKFLGRAAFGIIYIASTKCRSAREASHQPAFMDKRLTISHTRLACLPSRWVSPRCSIKSYWTESHMEFCQTSTTELLCQSMWSLFRWLDSWWLCWWSSSGVVSWCWCKFFGELALLEEWVWNLETKLCCTVSGKWNVNRVAVQEFNIWYKIL